VGHWNGIGGKVENGEYPQASMKREFEEETGVSQHSIRWRPFADLLTWTHNLVTFFSSFSDQVELVRSATDEEVRVFDLVMLPAFKNVLLPNVRWLVEMALSMRDERLGGDGRESSSFMVVSEGAPKED
jgi:8-oxo-dGTP pyrophosphatase MutT (NUDIX family)